MRERPATNTDEHPYFYAATLTACEGTWLAHPPDEIEQQQIEAALKEIRQHRRIAVEMHQNPTDAKLFSLDLFKDPRFAPLFLSDRLIEQILQQIGEPPIVQDPEDQSFATYMRHAALCIATSRVRRDLAAQLRRFLPGYAEQGQWKEAVTLDHNAFRTLLGNEVSPFLVQITLGGLARWYEQHEA